MYMTKRKDKGRINFALEWENPNYFDGRLNIDDDDDVAGVRGSNRNNKDI